MGIGQSPSIITNGLVFNYDMYNTKSYKGPPLRNHIAAISPTVQSGTGYVLTGGTEIVDIPTLGQTNVTFCNLQNTGSSWCCVNFMNYGNAGNIFIGSTLYTYLILYRSDSGYTNGNWMYRYEYSSSGTYQTEAGVHTTGNRTYLGNGWYYAWGTFTTQAATTNLTCYSFSYNYSSFNDKISVAKVCILPGNYSGLHPRYWPDTNTTRSVLQSIIDIGGNNNITPTSLTYNADGTFSFNGSSNFLTLSLLTSEFTGNMTAEVWIRPTASPGDWVRIVGSGGNSGNRTFGLWYNVDRRLLWQRYGGADPAIFPASPTLTLNAWNHVVATTSGSSHVLYLNGVSIGTATAAGPWADSGETPTVGFAGFHTYVTGQISNVKLYTRGLSGDEVLQNFNTQRGMYGI